MPTGARSSPSRPSTHGVAALASVARVDSGVADELADLCHDAVEAMRAQLEHGTVEDRIAVFKALAPMIRELNRVSDDTATDAATEAQALLLGHWQELA